MKCFKISGDEIQGVETIKISGITGDIGDILG